MKERIVFMKKKLSPRFLTALTLFSLIGQIAWVVENMYLNVFIYKLFNASAADISAMVAASAIAATLTTVFIGALSDKIGKRKLFICSGYILWGISILGFALIAKEATKSIGSWLLPSAASGVSLVIALDCIMTFFGSSANDAAFNAWLTDSTDHESRGAAEGINAMMPLVAILAVFGGFMGFDLNYSKSWINIFTIIGCVVTAVGILGFFLIREPKIEKQSESFFGTVVYGFRPSTVKKNRSLYFSLALFILFNISIQIFMPYLILYYEVSLGMYNYVFIMAPAIILASVVTAIWGKVYDKKGFDFSSAIALLWLCAGYIVLYFFRATAPVFIGSLLMMCGYLSGMAVFGAKIRDLTPAGKSGMLQGVRICSQVLIPGIVGPFIGKTVLANAQVIINNDGTESFVPNKNIFLAALLVILLLAFLLLVVNGSKKPRLRRLKTPFEEDPSSDWTEYPRPQMKRESYLSLCGRWDLSVKKTGTTVPLGKILVPFPPESEISGIGRAPKKGEIYIYETTFLRPEDAAGRTTLLHFGAVDQICDVYLNEKHVAHHVGGYLPFTISISDSDLMTENILRVEVKDELDTDIPYGKQRKKRGGMWYTPISGIWQPVWLECVPKEHIEKLLITTTLHSVTLGVAGGASKKTLTVGAKTYTFEGHGFSFEVESPRLWTPEDPYLYEFTLTAGEDTVTSYFALRTMTVEQIGNRSYLVLNDKPYFCHGLLDQGYYSDGIYLPATPDGYRCDIQKMKDLGFNMLRKHIKIEPDIFYYECDRLGMIVFQDMVNNGKYNFLIDTALPTIGMKKGISHRASKTRREHFETTAYDTIKLLYNHPSVCYYTIFNEGWGQYDADALYDRLKAFDPTRIFDTTSGWFFETKSDVQSEHIYFKKLDLKASEKPLVLSEFGGYSCKIAGHAFNLDNTYGYRYFETKEAFADALEKLYRDEVIPMIDRGLCAAVLTQVSDVEDETNGLLTYDRKVLKVEPERMRALASELQSAFTRQF